MGNGEGGFPHDPWQGLDRLSFCENAILLEIKDPCQGKAHKTRPNDSAVARIWRDEPSLRNFLDDAALIAAGPGGKDNVVAACLEWSTNKELCLRVARNEGFDKVACKQLEDLLNDAVHHSARNDHLEDLQTRQVTGDEFETQHDTFLPSIVLKCRNRLGKHISRLLGQLKHAQCQTVGECFLPKYHSYLHVAESKENLKMFGPYNAHTHFQYMQHVAGQLDELRTICGDIDIDQTKVPPLTWCRASTVAYQCRKSGALKLFLKANLRLKAKIGVLDISVDEIVERIGKIARFCRASRTISMFMTRMTTEGITLMVRGVPTSKIEVEELKGRTVADIVARGGPKVQAYPETQVRNMLQRWPRYRVHAEIQLLIFYEEHSTLEMVGHYIGGDKLCCFLCHELLVRHGRFNGNGCHQSLYSLWMVPNQVTFVSLARANQFHRALQGVCNLVYSRAAALRGRSRLKRHYGPQNESFANLSRLSFGTVVGRIFDSAPHLASPNTEICLTSIASSSTLENTPEVGFAMVSPIQSLESLSASSPLAILESQSQELEPPIPSGQSKAPQDAVLVLEAQASPVVSLNRRNSAAIREHRGRRRHHRRHRRPHRTVKAITTTSEYHSRRHRRHRRRNRDSAKARSSHHRSQAWGWSDLRHNKDEQSKNGRFLPLIADIMKQLLCCFYI